MIGAAQRAGGAEYVVPMDWTPTIMGDDDKPEWWEQLAQHPWLALPTVVAFVAGGVGLWAQYAVAMKRMADERASNITLACATSARVRTWLLRWTERIFGEQ